MAYQVLTAYEARVVEQLALTMFPKGGSLEIGASEARVVDYVDRYLMWLPKQDRALMRAMFVMFGTLCPEDVERRTRWMRGWDRSRFYPRRIVFQALRSALTLGYMADPAVLRSMGIESGTDILERRQLDAIQPEFGVGRRIAANEVGA